MDCVLAGVLPELMLGFYKDIVQATAMPHRLLTDVVDRTLFEVAKEASVSERSRLFGERRQTFELGANWQEKSNMRDAQFWFFEGLVSS